MNKIFATLLSLFILSACSSSKPEGSYGEAFENSGAVELNTALKSYEMGIDTVFIIKGKVDNVCTHSGCWIMFKNQGKEYYINTLEKFILPKNVLGKKAIAKGRFVKDEENEISFEASGIIVE